MAYLARVQHPYCWALSSALVQSLLLHHALIKIPSSPSAVLQQFDANQVSQLKLLSKKGVIVASYPKYYATYIFDISKFLGQLHGELSKTCWR